MKLVENISNNYTLLVQDLVGFTVSLSGVGHFFLHILIAVIILSCFYFFGNILKAIFFKEIKEYTFFISIALGYIVIGTGIGILGVLSILRSEIIWLYLLVIIFISVYSFSRNKNLRLILREINHVFYVKRHHGRPLLKGKKDQAAKFNLIAWAVLLFVVLAFLRLMTPEITEDGYHTDLPRLYIATQTTIHESRDLLHVIPYPQLAEMIYIIPIFLGDKEATRFIHFGFYLLIIFLLFQIAKSKVSSFVVFAPLLFVTSPIVIRYSPSQYVDFFMVFSFLLSILLIKKDMTKRTIILSGILFGSVLSIKMWTLIYLPAMVVFIAILNNHLEMRAILSRLMLFIISSLCVPLLWYIRAFLITGNPIYPIFSKIEYLDSINSASPTTANYFGFNYNMFAPQNMVVYSPLFFLGIVFLLLNLRHILRKLKKAPFAAFFVILTIEQLVVKVDLGRYLIAWYAAAITVVSAGWAYMFPKSLIVRLIFISMYLVLLSYYFVNTLIMLPYGFGWADKNAYLTRVLGRDNANYYDFDQLFDKWISKKDLVATHGLVSYYYADFSYIDINYIFSKENRSFDLLKKRGVTRLLVKGGDSVWFCKTLSLTNCDQNKIKLLATWPTETRKYNLYELR